MSKAIGRVTAQPEEQSNVLSHTAVCKNPQLLPEFAQNADGTLHGKPGGTLWKPWESEIFNVSFNPR